MHEEKYPLIADPRDPRYLSLRSLQNESSRLRKGLFLIEGIRHVSRAAEQNSSIELLFVEPSILSSPFGQKLVRRLRKSGTPGVRLTSQLYRALTLAGEPQGIGAVMRQKWSSVDALKPLRDSLWLAVESIEQAGNLGTIIRTAEAAGVDGIFLLGHGIDPWDPVCVRASMGSLFSQRFIRCSIEEFAEWARRNNVTVFSSSPDGQFAYKALRYRWPAVLSIGSERQGLSSPLLEISDFTVRIPMNGRCDSINAAVATGVILFEMSSHRRRHG